MSRFTRALGAAAGGLLCFAHAAAAAALTDDLETRLAQGGIDAVNEHLAGPPAAALQSLHRLTAACRPAAVSLTVKLGRGRHAQTAVAHGEALRAAMGRCPGLVLALLEPAEVPRACMSMASWGAAHTARELRRRIAEIDADATLRATERGKACRAAYHHELHHRRVVVQRASGRSAKVGATKLAANE